MPSFLNKVFGYKKQDDKDTTRPSREASDGTLLDGKYEAIGPIVSPTASTFVEAQQTAGKDTDRDAGFSLFKHRGRGAQKSAKKHSEALPHLTLQLPGPKQYLESRPLSAVFEADPDAQIVLNDAVIAEKRLSPLEALILIRACTQAISERGLETLGIMHPHWFSASPEVQRRLISLFIRSLTQNRITTLSPTPTSSTSAFENELRYTRSPYDVAAVLRWGLRHLSLENGHFGKDTTEWGWYNAFFEVERNASYPFKAFSELLVPRLPASHIELLTATLGLISSLASHAETNSISGSKLSKFLGLWLLLSTRTEESDNWNRFYARWEHSGRVLEHLFLAHLREESAGQRLPTRLQELVKSYPYKSSAATDDGLLSRPRFSTRQHDALFVRVETLLVRSAERPKQHPIQLLLEAFQLPIDNTSGDQHIALWNALKTAATPEDPEGPQFTRIFVDETIHLLSLIPADNNLSTLSTPLTSPIAKIVSRKRSSSFTKTSNANSGSTPVSPPVSPTSPSSTVVTDWAQFTLSGFGDTPTTQPLSALLSPDDDVEVTQPWISRKPSRHRGKSRTRGQRSEDHEPLNTPPSSQPDPEPSIIETKLASVHVVQMDEAFIDFWSDAIVDPISANWPSFVVCGLKPAPSSEQPIRWLVIEQTYSRQESSRVPSPDGRRGRSPRPSFKSDISGFRINSVFSSARKRFSMFSKSATDLDLKKSGGKTPVAGELGEILVEEEPTFPSASPTNAGLHVDENGPATVTSDRTPDVAEQLKAGEIFTTPIDGVPSTVALKEGSDPIQAAVVTPSIEPTSQSEGGCNGSSVLPRPSVSASEETISVERDSPRTIDGVTSKVDSSANLVITPLTADTPHSRSIQDTCDPTPPASGPAPSVENSVARTVHVKAENAREDITIDAEDRPIEVVAQITDRDEHLHTAPTGETSDLDSGSQKDIQAVAMLPIPETVTLAEATPVAQPAVIAAVHDEASERAVDLEEPHVTVQPSQKASADLAAAFAVGSLGHKIDDLTLLSSTAIVTETGAHPEARPITSVVDEEVKGVAEHVEIPTPAPELVMVEETPGQEVSVDACAPAGAAGTPSVEPEVLDSAAPQFVVFDGAASQPVPAELQATSQTEVWPVTHSVDELSVEVVDTSVEVVAAETDPAADQVAGAAEEAQTHVQDTIVHTSDALLIDAVPAAKVDAAVSAGNLFASQAEDVAPAEVETQSASQDFVHEDVVETQDMAMPAPIPEHATAVDETRDSVITIDASEPVEAVPATTPKLEQVEAKTQDPVGEAVVEAGDLPTILAEEPQPSSRAEPPAQAAAEALPNRSNPEAALVTQDEIIAVTAEAKSTPDLFAEDAEACTPLDSAPVEDALEVAVEASSLVPTLAIESEPVEDKSPELVAEEPQISVGAAPIASEAVAITPIVPIEAPVAQVEQAPMGIDQASSASVPQFVDEAPDAPVVVAVSVPEEIATVQVEAQLEDRTAHIFDEPLVEDAELAPELVPVEETRVVVGAREPEPVVAEPDLTEISAPAPDVDNAPAHVEAEESAPVTVEVDAEVDASQPEISETSKVDEEPQKAVDVAESMAFDVDVSTREPAEPSEEIAHVEP